MIRATAMIEEGVHMPSQKARELVESVKHVPNPVLKFPVYPERKRGKLYILVSIYKSSQHLKYMRAVLFPEKDPETVWGFTWKSPCREGNMIGQCCFDLSSCTDFMVAHEFIHAACVWADRKEIPPADRLEWDHASQEEIADAHGEMVSQFWQQFTKHYPRKECWQFHDGRRR